MGQHIHQYVICTSCSARYVGNGISITVFMLMQLVAKLKLHNLFLVEPFSLSDQPLVFGSLWMLDNNWCNLQSHLPANSASQHKTQPPPSALVTSMALP